MPLTDNTQRQIARYRSLVQVTAALARQVRTGALLRVMHTQVQALFASPVTLLARQTPDGGWDCQTLESENVSHQWLGPRKDGLLERVLSGHLSLENDLPAYVAREGLSVVRVHFRHDLPHTLSWMGVPLRVADQVVGVLSVQSYEPAAFLPEDLEFLEILAIHLGIALDNAALHERLESEANTDPLTSLLNRRQFTQRSEAALDHPGPYTLGVLDIQEFKAINDQFGHAAGDVVLRGVADMLSDLSAGHGEAFRLGGDEFAVLLPMECREAEGLMRRTLAALGARAWPVVPFLNVGLVGKRPAESLSSWLRRADTRMYDAKRRRTHLLDSPAL